MDFGKGILIMPSAAASVGPLMSSKESIDPGITVNIS